MSMDMAKDMEKDMQNIDMVTSTRAEGMDMDT
jgi:hypothetical protein